MRFFQKAVRRAGLEPVYSKGFSPHMLMSFAQPLGVGITSEGEYFDIDLKSAVPSESIKNALNEQMPPEMRVLEAVKIPEDKGSKCMTLVAAADYEIGFCGLQEDSIKDDFEAFLAQEQINILKKTKKNEEVTDIRPLIYSAGFDGGVIRLRLAAGSVNNLKPQLVINAFCEFIKAEPEAVKARIHRKELLADTQSGFVALYRLGEEIF